MRLYHFTSDFGARGIRESGDIRPGLHDLLSDHMVWLTSDPKPNAASLGLSRGRGGRRKVDRMAHRFAVVTSEAMPWREVRERYEPALVQMLESAPGVNPAIWFVAFTALKPALYPTSSEREADEGLPVTPRRVTGR